METREAEPVRFADVTKTYRRAEQAITVLDSVSLEVASGEFVALMGPSGSGKTTLLNLVAGLDRPTTGVVTVGAANPALMNDRDLSVWRARSIGFVFQRYHLLDVLTAAENVEVPLMLLHLPSHERKERVQTAFELVGLVDRMKHFPSQLSGGQEQRVAIARAIVTSPQLLLCDEPTGDLDAKSAGEILDLLQLINRELKKSIIMVTHDRKAAQRAQRVFQLEKGFVYQDTLAAPGTP